MRKTVHDGLLAFHEKAQECGGLIECAVIQRNEYAHWLLGSLTNERLRPIIGVADNVLKRWHVDASDKLCLLCDATVHELENVEALVITQARAGHHSAIVSALCPQCASREQRELQTKIMAVMKRKMWPDLREAPPIHDTIGHA